MIKKVIIVADEVIHEFLSERYPDWDTQYPVTSIDDLWNGLSNGSLSDESQIVLFSDQYHDVTNVSEDFELAVATLAPEAMTMIISYEPSLSAVIAERVRQIASRDGLAQGPLYFINPETPVSDIDNAMESHSSADPDVDPSFAKEYTQTQVVDQHPDAGEDRNGIVITSTSSKGGSGKCVPLSTVTFDPITGLPRTFAEIFADENADLAYSFDGKEIFAAKINDKIDNGTKTTYSLTTSTGRNIRATANHPFLTRSGWKSLGDLAVGEDVALPRSMPLPLQPVKVSKSELAGLAKALVSSRVTADKVSAAYRLDVHQLRGLLSLLWANKGSVVGDEVGIDHLPSRVCAERIQSLLLRLEVQSRIEVLETGRWFLHIEPEYRAKAQEHVKAALEDESGILVTGALLTPRLERSEGIEQRIENPADGTVFWDAVASIEYHGPERVVDLEILDTHNFVANDIIVHNSSTALLLASQIAQSSRRSVEAGLAERPLDVCVVDMDVRDGQIGFLIGQMSPTALNIRAEGDWSAETIRKNLVYDNRLGIHALLAPKRGRTADDTPPEFYAVIIRELRTIFDVVIMDTSVNYLDRLIETVCLPEADAILFVTDLGISSVFGMVRWFDEVTTAQEDGGIGIDKGKIGVVINKSIPGVGMDRERVTRASQGAPLVGVIPLDSAAFFTAANRNRLDEMLNHPTIGPAYFKLARKVIGNRYPLTEVVPQESIERAGVVTHGGETPAAAPTGRGRKAQQQAPTQQQFTPVPLGGGQRQGVVPPPPGAYPGYQGAPVAEPVKKRGLFGRK